MAAAGDAETVGCCPAEEDFCERLSKSQEPFAEIGGENLRIASQNFCETTVPNSKISQKFCEKPFRRIWVVGTFRKSDFAGAEQALILSIFHDPTPL
ncbi:hypothetical protein K439DRAFT_456853 [Ramaria rubella]|nr:hypothetical protein K439DRAFT_456853 [Ramaria rubella]